MKGPFGLLLIGGGAILLVGLFTGKITFPGAVQSTGTTPPSGAKISTKPDKKGNCPIGYVSDGHGNCIFLAI